MDIVQFVTLVAGILGIIWYLQRSISSLRTELKQEIRELRADVTDVKERLARIEGFLGIGMPAEAAAAAPGAGLATAD